MSSPLEVAVHPNLILGADSALAFIVATAPLLSSEGVAPVTATLRRLVPILGSLLAAMMQSFAAACQHLRVHKSLTFVMIHGALTYACGDIFAQAASQERPMRVELGARSSPQRQRRALQWRPLRTARTALAGLASDAVPFYFWGAALQNLPAQGWVHWLMRILHVPAQKLPAALLGLKIVLHTAVFQPITTAGLMLTQALLRRDSWAEASSLLRRRFAAAYLVAASTFAVGGLVVYSLSSIALQSALRNAGVLGYAIYMALIAN